MKFRSLLIALAGLTACTFSPENMFYEVTERSSNGVSIQTNRGNMDLNSPEVAQMLAHMDAMAFQECMKVGKAKAAVKSERAYTTSAYYSWIERNYQCK